jgi:CBS domain-containing protein
MKLVTLSASDSVLTAAQKMAEIGVGSVIILEGSELSGIFTERDLMRICAKDHLNLGTIPLKDVMTKNLTVANPDDSVDDILSSMITKKFRHMPVMEGKEILGIISIGDAIKDKMNKAVEEADMLRQYIHGN